MRDPYEVLGVSRNASDDEIRFVNREEDCGDEGLRKSKMSYHPIELIEKNTVTIKYK